MRHQNHHQLLKIPKYLLPSEAAIGQAAAGCEDEEAPALQKRAPWHTQLLMGGRPACFNLMAWPSSRNAVSCLAPEPSRPPAAHPEARSHRARCWEHQAPCRQPKAKTGSAIKSPRFPLFPLPRQLLPRSAGWGSGICHGKQRAGNKFPNCHMLTDTRVTSV